MLIKIRPPYKVCMHQDQAHTRAHDTYGTITQHFPSRKTLLNSLTVYPFFVLQLSIKLYSALVFDFTSVQ